MVAGLNFHKKVERYYRIRSGGSVLRGRKLIKRDAPEGVIPLRRDGCYWMVTLMVEDMLLCRPLVSMVLRAK